MTYLESYPRAGCPFYERHPSTGGLTYDSYVPLFFAGNNVSVQQICTTGYTLHHCRNHRGPSGDQTSVGFSGHTFGRGAEG